MTFKPGVFKLFVISLLMLPFIASCKLEIAVPEGGAVVSTSGTYDCDEGKTCSFDVVDIYFDENFSGDAADGYQFTGWKYGNQRLCGGSTKDCKLFTSGFEGNSALMAVLESNRRFYLEPVFAKKNGSGTLSNRPFSICVDKSMYKQGYQSDLTVDLYDDGRKEGSKRTISTVSGPVQYQGKTVMELHEAVTNTGPLNASLELTTYHQVDMNQLTVRTVGIHQLTKTPITQEVEGTFTPEFLQRFDLKVGDSYTTEYTIDLSFPDGSSPNIAQHVETTFIYDGVETITIPAGTFEACRVHRYDTVDGVRSESYNWIGKDNGILLLESDENFIPEAAVTAATVKGVML